MAKDTIQDVKFDADWAHDWQKIVAVYDAIDQVEVAFSDLESDLSYLRVLAQDQLVFNLKKYAWTLQAMIISKYKDT